MKKIRRYVYFLFFFFFLQKLQHMRPRRWLLFTYVINDSRYVLTYLKNASKITLNSTYSKLFKPKVAYVVHACVILMSDFVVACSKAI